MKKKATLASFVLGIFITVSAILIVTGQTAAPISLHPQNPHYFLFRGKPTILITSGEHYGAVLNLDFNYVKYLDTLRRDGLNHTRTFTGATYVEPQGSFNIDRNTLAPGPNRFLAPWARSDTPGYAGGGNKFDLSRWDEAYFKRWKEYLTAAGARGIIVEINLFTPFYGEKEWERSPFHEKNNVNGLGAIPKADVYTVDKHKGLLEVQERFVRKLVAELKSFDNIYYEICNEPYATGVPRNWEEKMIEIIVDAEKQLPAKHLISLNISNGSQKIKEPNPAVSIYNFHYSTPPDSVGMNYELNKVIGDNETGFHGVADDAYRMEGWDFLLAGGGLYNNLDYSFTAGAEDGSYRYPQTQPGGGGASLRRQLRILRDFIYSFDYLRMKPDNSVISSGNPSGKTARALVDPGKAYAVYVRPLDFAKFSVRWTGQLEPKFSEEYTFSTVSNDGVRLWIDDRLVVDNWTDHSETENKGTIRLQAGRKTNLKLEFFYSGGAGVTRCFWASANQKRELVAPEKGFEAEYFSGVDLKKTVMMRTDPKVDFTWGDKFSPVPQEQSSETALMIQLPAGAYRSEWIDPLSGRILKREAFNHAGGERKFVAPAHKEDIALKIRR